MSQILCYFPAVIQQMARQNDVIRLFFSSNLRLVFDLRYKRSFRGRVMVIRGVDEEKMEKILLLLSIPRSLISFLSPISPL